MTSSTKNQVIPLENLKYLKIREVAKAINQKDCLDFTSKMKKIASENSGKIILSVPLKECFVSVEANIAEVFFKLIGKDPDFDASDVKLKLLEVQILHGEYFDEGYFSTLSINFVFENQACNNHWSCFSLRKLSFNDEKCKIVDNSMGHCLDPKFEQKRDYIFVKDQILKAKKELGV